MQRHQRRRATAASLAAATAPRYKAPVTAPAHHALLAATALGLGAGCAEWPRFQHLPAEGDPDALPGGSDPGDAVEVEWTGPIDESESGSANGLPVGTVVTLGPGTGLLVEGVLDGTGWLGDQVPDRTGACGTLAFPLGEDGVYGGDVDWSAIEVEGGGYLCAALALDREGVEFDLVPYRLDACDEPGQAVVDAEGLPWGYDLEGTSATWAAPVDAGDRVGVALAAFWPQDSSLQVGWTLGLSVSTSGLCPTLSEVP